ncbi:MAG TPA: glutamyl-tRNA reductase [Pseudolysinimonas sp.]
MLLCLSSNHRNATSDVLEKLSVGAPAATHSLVESEPFVNGAVVLATCNRFEAYLDIDEPLTGGAGVAAESVILAMAEASGIGTDELRSSVLVHEGGAAAEHLFAVSSGLDSVVIGEDEISGQVSRALERARSEGTTSSDLERLFQRATHTSRGVRNKTALGGTGRSMVGLALELATSRIPDWAETRVLVIGTGRLAGSAVVRLRALAATDVRVFSPSGRADTFATRHGLRVENHLGEAVAGADVVIACSTGSSVGTEVFVSGRRQIVVDLGLPRNVNPAVAAFRNVELIDLETLKLHAPLEEFHAYADARSLIGHAAAGFAADSAAAPAITALRRHVLNTVDAEIARARSAGAGLETEAALRHLAGVLLHGPSVRIREIAAEGRIEELAAALHVLYAIEVPTESAHRSETA